MGVTHLTPGDPPLSDSEAGRAPPTPTPNAGTRLLWPATPQMQVGEAGLLPARVRPVQPRTSERGRSQSLGAGPDPQRSREAGRPGCWHPKEAAEFPRQQSARSPGRWAATPTPQPPRPAPQLGEPVSPQRPVAAAARADHGTTSNEGNNLLTFISF